MTLIVARRNPATKKIAFAGDTRQFFKESYSAEDPFSKDEASGVFKFSRVGNYLIAFAGNVFEAEGLLKLVFEKKLDAMDVLSYLAGNQVETEFLVSIVVDGNDAELYEVKSGQSNKVDAGWIGNQEAFNDFQKYFLQSNEDFLRRLKTSLEQVIHSKKYPDIGGLVVIAIQDRTHFFETGMLSTGFDLVYNENGNFWGIGEGSSAIGTYTIESCDYEDDNFIYYYFHQAKFLIAFKAENGLFKCVCKKSFASSNLAEEEISQKLGRPTTLQFKFY